MSVDPVGLSGAAVNALIDAELGLARGRRASVAGAAAARRRRAGHGPAVERPDRSGPDQRESGRRRPAPDPAARRCDPGPSHRLQRRPDPAADAGGGDAAAVRAGQHGRRAPAATPTGAPGADADADRRRDGDRDARARPRPRQPRRIRSDRRRSPPAALRSRRRRSSSRSRCAPARTSRRRRPRRSPALRPT